MSELSRAEDAAVTASAALIIGRLDNRLGEVTRSMQQLMVSEISELRGDAQLVELLRDSVGGNVGTIFSAIQHDIPIESVEAPTAALEYARRLAQRGVSVNALVRAYRLGQQALLNIVFDEIGAAGLGPQRSLDVFKQMTATTFKYIDWISQEVVAVYQSERDRWLENRNSTRALQVRELLDADTTDADAVTTAIGYPLRRLHLALVVWDPDADHGDELVRMEQFVRGLSESIGSQDQPLFVAADRLTGWCWIPLKADAAADAVARARAFAQTCKDAPLIALGDPLPGIDGFRRSHRQALGARAVAMAAGPQARRVVANSDYGLSAAALLSDNIDAAQVWVGEVLGPLASATESDKRLRETLQIFLHARSSYKAAAKELNLHFNSVRYRVQRAEERRGRPITSDRLDVEIALLLCHWFDGVVLH
ncbi:MAG: helix-turn-helix domain-containing protein [Mycobacterium sp.]